MNLQELTAEECLKLPADILQWLKKRFESGKCGRSGRIKRKI